MAKGVADPFPFPDGCCVKDAAFTGMAEEAIYSRIFRPKPQGNKPQGQPGQGQGQGQGKQPGQNGAQQRKKFGEFSQQGTTPADKKQKERWEGVLVQSAAIAKGRGKLPGGIERLVKELIEPTIPWFELLRQWLREQTNDDWNWQKPNTMYGQSEFILPVLLSEKIGSVVFATDTSGSIDQTALAQFQTEKQTCLDDLKPNKLIDIYCDAAIHAVREYGPGDQIALDAPGGGGTDFRPVFDHIDTLPEQPKCLVFLTDTMGTFPDSPPAYPVLWVTWYPGATVPWGTLVKGVE